MAVLVKYFFVLGILFLTVTTSARMCKLKRHTHKAVQVDLNNKKCWDHVKIMTCYGYCSSHELADWQFPYKESFHQICGYGERRHASHKLRHCEAGVEPGTELYHYVEAVSCRCQKCSSDDTSCEWLTPDSSLFEEIVFKQELEEELEYNQKLIK